LEEKLDIIGDGIGRPTGKLGEETGDGKRERV
jgi:hypothetical protein